MGEAFSPSRSYLSTGERAPFSLRCAFQQDPIHSVFELGRTDVRTFVECETDSAFDSTRHLWKVLLITYRVKLDGHYLILCTHRSISDPLYTVNLAREMLASCAAILSGGTVDAGLLPVCPNFEEIAATIPESLFSEKNIDGAYREKTLSSIPYHEARVGYEEA